MNFSGKKITNSGFASKIPMACFQNIKTQAHLFNVISQADCNVLAFYALLKQNQTKTRKIPQTNQRRKEKKVWRHWCFLLPFLMQIPVSLMVFIGKDCSQTWSELRTTGSLINWWEKPLVLSVYLENNLRWLLIPTQNPVNKLNQNQTKVPNLLSFYDLHVMEKPKQEGCDFEYS